MSSPGESEDVAMLWQVLTVTLSVRDAEPREGQGPMHGETRHYRLQVL